MENYKLSFVRTDTIPPLPYSSPVQQLFLDNPAVVSAVCGMAQCLKQVPGYKVESVARTSKKSCQAGKVSNAGEEPPDLRKRNLSHAWNIFLTYSMITWDRCVTPTIEM